MKDQSPHMVSNIFVLTRAHKKHIHRIFVVADISMSIIGINLLLTATLQRRLVDRNTKLSVCGTPFSGSRLSLVTHDQNRPILKKSVKFESSNIFPRDLEVFSTCSFVDCIISRLS